jgi:perosamine synthetase
VIMMKIPLSRPDVTEDDIEAVVEVLKTPYLSLGPKIEEFERKLAQYVGSKYAVAVNSGTSGLHLAVKALGLGERDEVITTPFSFVASANCILFERATPVFVDIDPGTFNMDVEKIEEKITKRTRAILPVHVFGRPCNMTSIRQVARERKLMVIEDACEALGAEWKGRRVGTFGSCAVFAFYPNKQMTMGEGGVIVTDSRRVAELCRSLRNQGRSANGRWLKHTRLGYNYRITDIQCALGVSQLERLDMILEKRNRVADHYIERLAQIADVKAPVPGPGGRMSWFVFVVLLKDNYGQPQRRRLMELMAEAGVETSNYFPPIHLQPLYRKAFGYKRGDFPHTESVAGRTLALPFHTNLSGEEIDYVCESLAAAVKRL